MKKMQRSLEKQQLQRLWHEMYKRSPEYSFMSEGKVRSKTDGVIREERGTAFRGFHWPTMEGNEASKIATAADQNTSSVCLKRSTSWKRFSEAKPSSHSWPLEKAASAFLITITNKQRLKGGSTYLAHGLRGYSPSWRGRHRGGSWSHCVSSQEAKSVQEVRMGYKTWRPTFGDLLPSAKLLFNLPKVHHKLGT